MLIICDSGTTLRPGIDWEVSKQYDGRYRIIATNRAPRWAHAHEQLCDGFARAIGLAVDADGYVTNWHAVSHLRELLLYED